MSHPDFNPAQRLTGRIAAWTLFVLGVVYIVVTVLGFLSLKAPDDPIGDPYFSAMELLIVLMAPFMILLALAVHAYAPASVKGYTHAALLFMTLAAGITSCVHFSVFTVSHAVQADWFFAFKWPSVIYALDILAWDWFYALALLFAAPALRAGGLERAARTLMIVSGVLCLAGLLGVALGDMQVRNVGIVGYGIGAPVVYLLLALVFGRALAGGEAVR